MPPNEPIMPDHSLQSLHDQLSAQAKHFSSQHAELSKNRELLDSHIQELERMIEALNAGISTAFQYFPSANVPTYREPGV